MLLEGDFTLCLEELWREGGALGSDVWSPMGAGWPCWDLQIGTHAVCISTFYSRPSRSSGNGKVLQRKKLSFNIETMFFHTPEKERITSIAALVHRLLPCFHNKTFFWNLPGPLPMSIVTNEQSAHFTVLNSPNLNLHEEMLEVAGVGWSRGCCNSNTEELGAKLLLIPKEKFA